MSLQGSQLETDDPTTSYMLQVGFIVYNVLKTSSYHIIIIIIIKISAFLIKKKKIYYY